jgi:hypothetical protein
MRHSRRNDAPRGLQQIRMSAQRAMRSSFPSCSLTLTEQVRERSFVSLGSPGTTGPFGVGVHETFRVNVRWVTPLGEETASTS